VHAHPPGDAVLVTPDELTARYGERFDQQMADAMVNLSGAHDAGLPGYLGMRFVEVGAGWCVCEIDITAALFNPVGVAHGAVVASLIDHTLGTTAMPVLPAGSWPATLEFKVNYLAPVREGVLRARGELQSVSRRTAVVAVECTNQDRLVAVALGTIAITPPKAPS
jgi:uncharacterized protein (TIGR00369 family)